MTPQKLNISLSSDLTFEMIFVEGGLFMMGDNNYSEKERPAHEVMVSSFYMSKYQVTQDVWAGVMGNSPSFFKGERRPVEQVSWNDAQAFLKKLNQETGKAFRLTSEAEWEYAARGSRYSQCFVFAGSDKLKQVGWYRENSGRGTHEVGLLLGNELGLYDMSGNVWEWCEDDWHDNYKGAPADGSAWADSPVRGAYRVQRGGSFINGAEGCRPTNRNRSASADQNFNIGFRLVLPLQ